VCVSGSCAQTVTIPGSGGKTVELEVLLFDSQIGFGSSEVILEVRSIRMLFHKQTLGMIDGYSH
jgi:hypothetical protein